MSNKLKFNKFNLESKAKGQMRKWSWCPDEFTKMVSRQRTFTKVVIAIYENGLGFAKMVTGIYENGRPIYVFQQCDHFSKMLAWL